MQTARDPRAHPVAGTLPAFVPATDATLRNPDPSDWLWPMQDGGTNQPAPIVYRDTLYVANTDGVVQALVADSGDLIWEYRVGNEVAPRGIVLYEDKLIFQTSGGWAVTAQPAHIVALDARSGALGRARPRSAALVWNVEMPDQYASNSGPIAANGLLIQGMGTCATYEEKKCFIAAYNANTGEQHWRFETVARSGEPGGDTWRGLPDR